MQVSTTRGSGWVLDFGSAQLSENPPATAGGTDLTSCI
jgi:hypothetical protein